MYLQKHQENNETLHPVPHRQSTINSRQPLFHLYQAACFHDWHHIQYRKAKSQNFYKYAKGTQ